MSFLKTATDRVKGAFGDIKLIFDTVRGKDLLVPWEHKPSDPLQWLEPKKPLWSNEQSAKQPPPEQSPQDVFFRLSESDTSNNWTIGDLNELRQRTTQPSEPARAPGQPLPNGPSEVTAKFIQPIDTKNLDL